MEIQGEIGGKETKEAGALVHPGPPGAAFLKSTVCHLSSLWSFGQDIMTIMSGPNTPESSI